VLDRRSWLQVAQRMQKVEKAVPEGIGKVVFGCCQITCRSELQGNERSEASLRIKVCEMTGQARSIAVITAPDLLRCRTLRLSSSPQVEDASSRLCLCLLLSFQLSLYPAVHVLARA